MTAQPKPHIDLRAFQHPGQPLVWAAELREPGCPKGYWVNSSPWFQTAGDEIRSLMDQMSV